MRATVWTPALLCAALVLASCTAGDDMASGTDSSILLPVEDDATLSVAVWFRTGSVADPEGKEGLAWLTGELLAQGGTESRTYEQILEALYPMAASYGVRVDKQMTTFSGRVHRDKAGEYLDLFTEAFLAPAFSEADFERVRTDGLNYLEKTLRYASDEELGKAALAAFVFEETRYAHPVTGTVAGLKAITLDDVRSFYRAWYTRDNAVIALGGAVTDALAGRLDDARSRLPAGAAPAPPEIAPAPLSGRSAVLVDKEGADASISFGFPVGVRRGEKDYYALWIANSWLGEHRNSASHLYGVIRETRGMNYGDYSYIEVFPEGGQRRFPPTNVARDHQLFEVWIRTLPNDWAHFALRAAMRELDLLIENGMSQEDFELTRDFLSKYRLHYADTTSRRLGFAIDDRFYDLEDSHLDRLEAMLGSLTLEDVNAAIRRHLSTDDLLIAIVTGEAEAMAGRLADDAPSPVSYPTPKPPEVLAEDEIIAAYPLRIAREAIRIVPLEDMFAD